MKLFAGISVLALVIMMSGYINDSGKKEEAGSTARPRLVKTPFLFAGTPLQQARYLLREVKENGVVSPDSAVLAAPLAKMVGQPVNCTMMLLKKYLDSAHIPVSELGFSGTDIAVTDSLYNVSANYFVIHDASTPNYGNAPFPANIDDPAWEWNNLERWTRNITHVFVNRAGQSKTMTDFSDTMQATKFEKKVMNGNAAGNFLHVELIQPRKNSVPSTFKGALAPPTGFTQAQYERLALLYIVASTRRGQWLIPAFHACIDQGIRNGHDDPQHFSIDAWNSALNNLLIKIGIPNEA